MRAYSCRCATPPSATSGWPATACPSPTPRRPGGSRGRCARRPRWSPGPGRSTRSRTRLPHVVAKRGALGVFCCASAETGRGGALKVEDGSFEAMEIAALHLLEAVAGPLGAAVRPLARAPRSATATARRWASGRSRCSAQCYSPARKPPAYAGIPAVGRELTALFGRFRFAQFAVAIPSPMLPATSRLTGRVCRGSAGRSLRAVQAGCHTNREVRYGGHGMLTVEYSLPDIEELARLVEVGQEKGFLTYEEIATVLEEVEISKEQVEDLHSYLIDHGIDVLESAGDPTPDAPAAEKGPELDLTVEPSLDSLRLYLRAIGRVSLLTAEQEVHARQAHRARRHARQAGHDRGQPAPRRLHRQGLPRPRPLLPRPHPGRLARASSAQSRSSTTARATSSPPTRPGGSGRP